MREIRLEQLLGRRVHDAAGARVGRIEEVRAEVEVGETGSDYVVREYHVGAYGALEALAGGGLARSLLRTFGKALRYRRHVVPWHLMDLRDPEHPRLTCRREELSRD
jgi:sporulation protein YlmC with PRC-barrel domain